MSAIKAFYEYIFVELADHRVNNWPLMSTPLYPTALIILYLYIVYKALPAYMAKRKAYNLKTVLAIYNMFQVIACVLLIYGVATSGWITRYSLGCELCDFSEDKMAVRMAGYVWWTMMLKIIELIETLFFTLRKKYNQVTVLHVYHHASTFAVAWLAVKFYPGGMLTLNIILNCFIHVLMYTYYFLSSLGPKMQKRLETLKPKLTAVQLIQLFVMFIHTLQILAPTCKVPKIAAIIHLPNIIINITFFVDFYKQNYLKKVN
ncbi:hypothetical protein ILUMI_27256 [Ignelater luminosus]|uniref:Elongation of very long chain fatty acids protein n=1 Tax=Ignelater luminosus TaxID=2038154 RepID=A0A8K0FXW8_IGNLU|nr:hypothetical protein ILUMI_27256 [Ignelater luminosus]